MIAQLSKWRPLLTPSTCKGLPESGEGSRSNACVLLSAGITLGVKYLRTGFYFHISFALHSAKGSTAKEKWAQGLRAAVFVGVQLGVCSSAYLWEQGWGGNYGIFAGWLIHQGIFICSLIYFMKIVQATQCSSSPISLCSEFTNHDWMGSATLQSTSGFRSWWCTACYWGGTVKTKRNTMPFQRLFFHFFYLKI